MVCGLIQGRCLDLKILNKKISDLKEYKNNPRINDDAVEYVKKSIEEFGYKVPIVIDKNNVIIAGHTRLKALKELGIKNVECVIADDLTPEQANAFRLADNKVSEASSWDWDKLDEELKKITDIDMEEFDFNLEDNFIDEMYDNFSKDKVTDDRVSITFVFNKEDGKVINDYIKENGKEELTKKIIEEVNK